MTWTARPWVARSIRVFVYVSPLVVSVAVAWVLSGIVPRADNFALGIARWFLIAAVSTVVLVGVDKLARRLLPLATLFGLTLAFPDQAPSRFRMALRNGSTAQLRKRITQARSGKPTDTPAEAAERVLELVIALNSHDRLTRGHSERVRAYTQMIGEEMGLTPIELDRMRWSGLLHDIGKLRISSSILNKPGKLTDAEFDEIKRHPEYGRELVAPLIGWLGESARAVWEHHERWDGRGYPYGLAGTDISLAGRIVSVADTYDVITSVRSYKKAISPDEARAELTRCAGTQFDPAVVRAFMNLSLGRLRLAMGPLSWLAQVPLFPQALTTTAATGTAGAATAFVGAAAASMGLGLAGDPIVPKDRVPVASAAAAEEPFDYIDIDTSRRTARRRGRGDRVDRPRRRDGDRRRRRPRRTRRPSHGPGRQHRRSDPGRLDTRRVADHDRRPVGDDEHDTVDRGGARRAAGDRHHHHATAELDHHDSTAGGHDDDAATRCHDHDGASGDHAPDLAADHAPADRDRAGDDRAGDDRAGNDHADDDHHHDSAATGMAASGQCGDDVVHGRSRCRSTSPLGRCCRWSATRRWHWVSPMPTVTAAPASPSPARHPANRRPPTAS